MANGTKNTNKITVKIGVSKLKEFLVFKEKELSSGDKFIIEDVIGDKEAGSVSLCITEITQQALNLLSDVDLGSATRGTIAMFLTKDMGDLLDAPIKTSKEFCNILLALQYHSTKPVFDMMFLERWYPVIIRSAYMHFTGDSGTEVNVQRSLGGASNTFYGWLSQSACQRHIEQPGQDTFTVRQMMKQMGFRATEIDYQEYLAKVERSKIRSEQCGALCTGEGLMLVPCPSWWKDFDEIPIGSPEQRKAVIIEPTLENTNRTGGRFGQGSGEQDGTNKLPFCRVFMMDGKQYGFTDIDNLEDYKFDTECLENLVLPNGIGNILKKVFISTSEYFGDLLKNKHGGMVILASGPTGVGKTLTAEIFSEVSKRPLYVMEVAELGTNPEKVEENLRKVFMRATRWNAILLFDEADIFLTKRDGDLARSALVGIFLRLLDYYSGLLFMTTNRLEVLDPAIMSRITLKLKYPALEEAVRSTIWETILNKANVKLGATSNGVTNYQQVAKHDLNGRQIRNLIRLLRVMYGNNITVDQVDELCQYA